VRQRSALELGDALLHHGVPAVLPLDVEERLVPVGEHRVVPPHRDGRACWSSGCRVLVNAV